jgi:hypothetical protein
MRLGREREIKHQHEAMLRESPRSAPQPSAVVVDRLYENPLEGFGADRVVWYITE